MSFITIIMQIVALDMVKLIKIAYFCSLMGKINFENLLVLEKPS